MTGLPAGSQSQTETDEAKGVTRVDDVAIAAWGDRLLAAYDTREPIGPLSTAIPDLTLADAYRIQLHQVNAWMTAGLTIGGFKVGLTSRAMQRQLGVDSPDFGHLTNDMIMDGQQPVPADRFISPRVEPEIAFVLGRDLTGPGLTLLDVLDAVDYAVASIEVIDSRIADWKIGLTDTVADNASSGALVLGTQPLRLDRGIDLATLGCVLTRNGEVVRTGAGGAVLDHPLNGVRYLANALGRYGRTLPAGALVMAGALCGAVPALSGDRFSATFAELGSVSIHFEGPERAPERNS